MFKKKKKPHHAFLIKPTQYVTWWDINMHSWSENTAPGCVFGTGSVKAGVNGYNIFYIHSYKVL